MSAERIKSDLKQLREALGATKGVDPELESLLRDVDQDIHRLLAGGDEASKADESLIVRVEEAANEFAMNHPQVAGVLQRLAEALGQIGI